MDADRETEEVRTHLLASAQVKRQTADSYARAIQTAARVIVQSLRSGGKVLICGNGGSAADSQHLAGEFINVLQKSRHRPAIPAIALTMDTSVLTAIGNDFGFETVFERQVAALGKPGDVVIAISTSGNSENVIRAVRQAKQDKLKTIVLSGADGGQLKSIADVSVCVPSVDVQRIQEAHIVIEHILCALVERDLFGGTKS